jgi:hypothetical protein
MSENDNKVDTIIDALLDSSWDWMSSDRNRIFHLVNCTETVVNELDHTRWNGRGLCGVYLFRPSKPMSQTDRDDYIYCQKCMTEYDENPDRFSDAKWEADKNVW